MRFLIIFAFLVAPLRALLGGWRAKTSLSVSRVSEVETGLINLVEVLEGRGKGVESQPEVFSRIEESIAELERSTEDDKKFNPITEQIEGTWKLLYTSSPGTNSPIQRTLTGYDGVSVYQVVNIRNTDKSFLSPKAPDVSNTVVLGNFAGGARLRVTALASTIGDKRVEPREGDGAILGAYPFGKSSSAPPRNPVERIDFAFQEAKLEACGFPSNFYVPYPVPFKLLGDEAKGWIDNTYISDKFRIARGNKGTCFLLKKVDPDSDRDAAIAAAQTEDLTALSLPARVADRKNKTKSKVVLVFPQQLGTEGDYDTLRASLQRRLGVDGNPGSGDINNNNNAVVVTVPLSRLDWPIGLIPSFFSAAYREGCLQPTTTLGFYCRKVDQALQTALQQCGEGTELEDVEISIVSHSIGGWIARSWLSEWCSSQVRNRVKSLVTLGSPHREPPPGTLMANLDQTRGLLKYINNNYPGAALTGVKYTSVISDAVPGAWGKGDSTPTPSLAALPSLLATGSYFALGGDGGTSGDGIIPVPTSYLEGANNVVLNKEDEELGPVYHSNFVGPVVWRDLPWYGSEQVIDRWISYV